MKNITAQYRDLLEGKMTKANFMANVRMQFPDYISPVNSYEDMVKILKSKRILSETREEKTYYLVDDGVTVDETKAMDLEAAKQHFYNMYGGEMKSSIVTDVHPSSLDETDTDIEALQAGALKEDNTDPYAMGLDANQRGDNRDKCPYEAGTPEADLWIGGWMEAETEKQMSHDEDTYNRETGGYGDLYKESLDEYGDEDDIRDLELFKTKNQFTPASLMANLLKQGVKKWGSVDNMAKFVKKVYPDADYKEIYDQILDAINAHKKAKSPTFSFEDDDLPFYENKKANLVVNGKTVKSYKRNGDGSYSVVYDDDTTDKIYASHDDWDKLNDADTGKGSLNEEYRDLKDNLIILQNCIKLGKDNPNKWKSLAKDARLIQREYNTTKDAGDLDSSVEDLLDEYNPPKRVIPYETTKGALREAVEKPEGSYKKVTGKDLYSFFNEIDRVNPYEVKKGIAIEMGMEYQPVPNYFTDDFNPESLAKATRKVLKNLQKDPAYYTNMISLPTEKRTNMLQKPAEVKVKADGYTKIKGFTDAKGNTEENLGKKERAKGSPEGVKEMKPSKKSMGGLKTMKSNDKLPKGVELMKEADLTGVPGGFGAIGTSDLAARAKKIYKQQEEERKKKAKTASTTEEDDMKSKLKDLVMQEVKKRMSEAGLYALKNPANPATKGLPPLLSPDSSTETSTAFKSMYIKKA